MKTREIQLTSKFSIYSEVFANDHWYSFFLFLIPALCNRHTSKMAILPVHTKLKKKNYQ